MVARVLIIAGSDSGGGAGIQGDIKTVTCLGGYAATAITALTAQNTQGVFGVHAVPAAFIAQQIELVLSDIGADAIKTGMLHSAEVIHTIADALARHDKMSAHSANARHEVRGVRGGGTPPEKIPLILDPVMVAKGGAALLEPDALEALITRLIPRAALLTPNLPEASLLIGQPLHTEADMLAAIPALRALGAQAVLLKGGHIEGDIIVDLLITADNVERFESPRINSRHTHGTGCTLASALATCVAQGLALPAATMRARAYVQAAIAAAPGLGAGHGPLGHKV